MYDIIVGRNESDKKKYGKEGTIFLGKHYVKMGQTTSLSNDVLMDVIRSHIVFVCGKRGGGKSYTMGVITEGMAGLPDKIRQNLSIVILDTMGVYWTMKYGNKKEAHMLHDWNMEGQGLNIDIYTPRGFHKQFQDKGIPTDFPFSLKPTELDAGDWCLTFEIDMNEPMGVLIEKVIGGLKKGGDDYAINEIIAKFGEEKDADKSVIEAVSNRFRNAEAWGLFDVKGTSLNDLAKPGNISVVDVSCY